MKNCNNCFALKAMYVGVALLLFMVGVGVKGVEGQVSSYTFAQASGTYTALSSSTIIHASGWDDAVTSITIPFTFTFNSVAYTSCNVSSNGFITFGATAPATTYYTPISGTTGYAGAISAFGRDLISNASTVVYGTEGSAPNRTFVIQWNNARRYSGSARNGNFNFQIRLNETTNVIQIIYGASATTYGTDLTVQVGLRGASNTDFNNRTTTNNWPGSTAGGANNATCNTGTGAGELPTNGLTYTWSPPVIPLNFTITSINYGSSPWCTGDTRSVTATIQNTGSTIWYASGTTNCTGNRQVAVSYKWNGDANWDVYNNRNPLPYDVAPGASVDVTFNVQSPNGNPLGANNLSINLIQQECAWFTSTYTSPAITIVTVPGIATTPSPANAATGVCYAGGGAIASVSWASVSGATSYDVYFGAGSLPGIVTSNVGTNSYSCGTLAANTTYYWKAVAKNSCGDATGSSTWTFTTAASPCALIYCTPTYTSGCSNGVDIITNVVLENLTNNSGTTCPGTNYIYYSSLTVPALSQGSTYTVAVTVGDDTGNWVAVWLDFNNDGDFADAGEYFNGGNPGSNGTANVSITVPAGATLGNTRMRIRGGEDSNISLQSYACGASSSGWGECEDYIVNIVGPAPAAPNVPTSNSPGCGSVTLTANGSAPAGETWYWQTSASSTDMSSSASTYVVTSSGTYYIRSRRISDGVWGAAASIAVVVNSAPTSVSAGSDVTICNGSSVQLSGSAVATTTTLFFENFESYTAEAYIGTDWLQYDIINGYSNWYYSSVDPISGLKSLSLYDSYGDYANSYDWDGESSSIAYNAIKINATNYNNLKISFKWKCMGEPDDGYNGGQPYDYGKVVWSTDGTTWNDVSSTKYFNQSSNQTVTNLDLSAANGQEFFIGFWWYNDGATGNDPGFMIDDVSVTGLANLQYSWTPAASLNNANISNPIASPSSTTTYTMTATANGCGVSDDVIVTVVNQPSVGTMTISESAICEGETVTISNTSSNGTISYWASSEGGYPCTWDIINEGYSGSSSFDFSFSANPNTSACEVDPYRIHVYSAAYNATCGWSWNFSGGSSQYINVYPAPSWGSINPATDDDICLLDGVSIDAGINNADPSSNITWRRKPSSGAVWTNGLANNSLDYPVGDEYDYQPIYSTTITGCDLSSPAPITVQVFDNGGWTGTVSSDWHNAANWCGGIPNSGTAVSITPLASNQPTISSGTANVCDITINLGAQLSLAGSQNLNVFCNFTNNGTFVSGTTNETLVFRGSPSNLFSGNDNINNLSIVTGASLEINDDLNILGDWTNDGTFDHNSHEIDFIGTQTQYIKSGGSSFGDIAVSNTTIGGAAIILSDNLNVTDQLTLNNGIVNTNGYSMNFGAATNVTVNSTASFINGRMQRTGSSQFTFPAGHINSRDLDGNSIPENYTIYSPISVTPSANATVEVEYIFDNSGMPDWWEHGGNMDATLHHVSDREHWFVNSDQNLSNVTLYWYDNGHAIGAICPHGFDYGNQSDFVASDLSVAYWSGSAWRDAGGITSGNHDNGSITSALTIPFGFKAPTYITFGSKNNLNPLPVELTYFTGECRNGNISLNWQTASETNNSHFLIQVSDNMKDFETIGKIYGAGNSSGVTNYDFSSNANFELSYYRLIQTDFDGKTKIYPPISISCKDAQSEPTLSVHPNPFESEIYVILEHFNSETARVEIINPLGQIVSANELEVDNGFVRKHYDLSNLKPGMYQLRVISGETVLSSKIIRK